jgi:hypothetical protein
MPPFQGSHSILAVPSADALGSIISPLGLGNRSKRSSAVGATRSEPTVKASETGGNGKPEPWASIHQQTSPAGAAQKTMLHFHVDAEPLHEPEVIS